MTTRQLVAHNFNIYLLVGYGIWLGKHTAEYLPAWGWFVVGLCVGMVSMRIADWGNG